MSVPHASHRRFCTSRAYLGRTPVGRTAARDDHGIEGSAGRQEGAHRGLVAPYLLALDVKRLEGSVLSGSALATQALRRAKDPRPFRILHRSSSQAERRGRARATVARRLCTVTSFYRYAEKEGVLAHSPAVHVRRPRIDYESHATGLDRNEVGGLLVAAGLGAPCEHTLVSLLALNGLRVSEATEADIDRHGIERGIGR